MKGKNNQIRLRAGNTIKAMVSLQPTGSKAEGCTLSKSAINCEASMEPRCVPGPVLAGGSGACT
eukprot:5316327-Prorocentrum_lima.AAC.1